MIKINIEDSTFETKRPYKAFAFMVALVHFGFEEGYAREIAELCYNLYVELDYGDGVDLIDWVCDNYNELPNDFIKVLDIFKNDLTNY